MCTSNWLTNIASFVCLLAATRDDFKDPESGVSACLSLLFALILHTGRFDSFVCMAMCLLFACCVLVMCLLCVCCVPVMCLCSRCRFAMSTVSSVQANCVSLSLRSYPNTSPLLPPSHPPPLPLPPQLRRVLLLRPQCLSQCLTSLRAYPSRV